MARLSTDPLVVEYKFYTGSKSTRHEFEFLENKFKSAMDRLFILAGLYEELYIVNALSMSSSASSLSFKVAAFRFTKDQKQLSFRIFPLFFVVKFILAKQTSKYASRLVMLNLVRRLEFESIVYLTIADTDDIKAFLEYYSLNYLSEYAISELKDFQTLKHPKILNLQLLHL